MDGSELAVLAGRVAAAAAAAGTDAEAEERLCGALGRRVRLYGLRHLGSPDRADDLVQEVLLIVLDRLRAGAVREAGSLVSFALGTARRLVADGRRIERRRRDLAQRYLPAVEPAVDPPELRDDARLDHCLGALGERERAIVHLTFLAESAPDEIARALRLTPQNVRVVRHRALARLRDCMAGDAA